MKRLSEMMGYIAWGLGNYSDATCNFADRLAEKLDPMDMSIPIDIPINLVSTIPLAFASLGIEYLVAKPIQSIEDTILSLLEK
jgi:hypothetical protein